MSKEMNEIGAAAEPLVSFRKKPVAVMAVRWDGSNIKDVFRLMDDGSFPGLGSLAEEQDGSLLIPTLEGEMTARRGDWIIRGVQGEVYPCKPDIFDATYERLCCSCQKPTGLNSDDGDICNECIELEDTPTTPPTTKTGISDAS